MPRWMLPLLVAVCGIVTATGTTWYLAAPLPSVVSPTPPSAPQDDMLAKVDSPLAPAYVGTSGCATCHAQQAAQHARSGHAQTLFSEDLATRYASLVGREFHDPEREAVFRYEAEGDKLIALCACEGQVLREVLQLGFGSGLHATTFLSVLQSSDEVPTAREHRVSYFAQGDRLGLTPNHSGVSVTDTVDCLGKVKRANDVTACIGCHSTSGKVVNSRLDDLRPHVGCESCHGPGRQHVAAINAGTTTEWTRGAPTRASRAEDEIQLCGRCHRLPTSLSTLPDPDDTKLVRFQPVGFLQSQCFKQSSGAYRCSTCHDPHAPAEKDPAVYNRQCSSCHGHVDQRQVRCTVAPTGDCVSCHMPAIEVHPGVAFHDHWVRKGARHAESTENPQKAP